MARQALLVARALRLTEILRLVSRFLPKRTQRAIGTARLNLRARHGEVDELLTLVPEKDLERRYSDVLGLLREANEGQFVGDYLEFGVYVGTSLSCMHRALAEEGLTDVRLFGFDSFEGLPAAASTEDTAGYEMWKPGQFSAPLEVARENLVKKGVDLKRTTLVKGWFEDTLTADFAERNRLAKAGVIMIDCDLYASAKTALEFSAPLIRDQAVIFFDDWWPATLGAGSAGERRAFEEFLEEHPVFSATELESYAAEDAKVFLVSRVEHRHESDERLLEHRG